MAEQPEPVPFDGDLDGDLERELVALGRALVVDPPRDDLADRVLARLATVPSRDEPGAVPSRDEPVAAATRPPGRRRLGWAIAAAVVLVLALVPPVRAAVLELLRIGGVVVREEPPPRTQPPTLPALGAGRSDGSPSGSAASATALGLQRAEDLLGIDVAVPTVLGEPTSVTLRHDGKVVELTWARPGGPIRLDAFVGSMSWGYVKTVWEALTPTEVDGHEAVWFGAPHRTEWLDRSGATHSESPRLAGPTLVWVVGQGGTEVTYRLEGPQGLPEALRVAESAR